MSGLRISGVRFGTAGFVLTTDLVLLAAALGGALAAAGSVGRATASYVFSAGCLIGAAEGAPKSVAALKKLAAR